ncbi:Signal recognition particle receptor FtsY [Buchnera aphidicola (Cinara curtihirsuta)]|nr:Signal recognition particle receptor FtsY [Buchnera aphidicola (Cinara curtihirsuta)]
MCSKKKNFFSRLNIFSKKKILIESKLKDTNNLIHSNKSVPKNQFFSFFKNSLQTAKDFFTLSIKNIFSKKKLDKRIFTELENLLLLSDFGTSSTEKILYMFKLAIEKNNITESTVAVRIFKKQLLNMLKITQKTDRYINPSMPFVILVIGVNGVGKTTTIVKLAHYYKKLGKTVLLSAGDTFRSAAIDQLVELGSKYNISVFSKALGSDPASVVFDSIQNAIKKKIDILIIDTAGRLHNKNHLIQELQKINRVIEKFYLTSFYEIFLVLDAGIGQNSVQQAKIFSTNLNITGSIITKLDGTAKGGVIFSIFSDLLIPVCYICTGEKITDFKIFNKKQFINSFLNIY